MPAGSVVAVLSVGGDLAYPMIEDHRFASPMPSIGMWTLPEIARHGPGRHPTAAGMRVRRQALGLVANDLLCAPPDAMLIDTRSDQDYMAGTRFDMMGFLASDAKIATLLESYRRTVSDHGVIALHRASAVTPLGSGCRRISVRPHLP